MKLNLSPAPHVHSPQSTRSLMLNVLIALIPCAAVGVWRFGLNALLLMLICMATTIVGEWLWQALTRQKIRVGDLSAAVTGLILALNLAPEAPLWIAVVGGLFAIIIVKGLFGGLGDNFINPALAARAMLLISWPVYMTSWKAPAGVDAVASPTPLAAQGGTYTYGQLFMGAIPGSIGEVCKLAILLGLVWLLCTRTITWRIPAALIASTFVFSWIFGYDPLAAILSGGMMFAAVFMATDYVTCPMTAAGQLVYAACTGLLIVVIRKLGTYPEGVTFAILLMNAAAPLLDRAFRRRVYGHEKEAKA